MRSIALVAVQLEEAKRMILLETEPHLRMALILLDNAAEVLIYRMCKKEMELNYLYEQLIDVASGRSDLDAEMQLAVQDAEVRYVSPARRKKIDSYFDAKVKYLVKIGLVEREVASVLRRLHDYRNEAYHNEKLRIGSLHPCVLLYFDVSCELLGKYRPI